MMGLKLNISLTVILLLCMGGLGGLFIGSYMGAFIKPTAEHQAIVDVMTIKDVTYSFPLVPKCVDSGKKAWGIPVIGLEVFEEGEAYEQSTWIWQRNGDTELAMTVWGPGEDQKTCLVELARLGSNTFDVKVKGELEVSMGAIYGGGLQVGYYSFNVEVQ